MSTPPQPTPGWYPDPVNGGQRWWDGTTWATQAPPPPPPVYQPGVSIGPQEKSSGIAVLLTVLWPGAGHLYLGLTKKAVPFVVANAIGFVLAWTIFLLPVAVVIWIVTLVMTVGKITDETNMVNDAIRRGIRIDG